MRTVLAILLMCITATAAVRFDGSDDVLHWDENVSGLNFTNELSVSYWMQKEVALGASAEYIGKGRLKNGNNLHWSIRNSSGKMEFNFSNPVGRFHNFTTSSTFLATNAWMHIGFNYRWNDSNSAAFYVNGDKVTAVWTANPTNCTGLTNNEPMRIGATYTASNAKMVASEAAIWNAVLEPAEIQALAKSRTAGTPLLVRRQSLRAYWPLRREFPFYTTTAGTNTYKDLSGYGQHLTPLNGPQARPGHLATP